MSKVVSKPSFEQAITELEEVVNSLENGEVELENAIKLYEKGDKLRKICQKKLDDAKLKVEKVIGSNGDDLITEEFDAD